MLKFTSLIQKLVCMYVCISGLIYVYPVYELTLPLNSLKIFKMMYFQDKWAVIHGCAEIWNFSSSIQVVFS